MAQRRLLIGTNLKMYKTAGETADYLRALAASTSGFAGKAELFVIPSFISLPAATAILRGSHIRLGAQNMYCEDEGPYTGEVSPLMLQELGGVSIVEIGHSERRHLFGESAPLTARKVRAALDHGFTPLLCVGETEDERNYGIAEETLSIQLKIGLSLLTPGEISRLWIAYEPVWSIGETGVSASAEYVEELTRHIRAVLTEHFGSQGANASILYGGSVNRENARDLIAQPHLDGLFVGRAAWDEENFTSLIREILPGWRLRDGVSA